MSIREQLNKNKRQIIQWIDEGKSTLFIAKQFNCNSGTVWEFLNDNGLKTKNLRTKNYGKTAEFKEEIIKRFNDGKSIKRIAKELELYNGAISQKMKEWGFDTSRHSKLDRSKPTLKSKISQVIEMYESGKSHSQISKELGYSRSEVSILLRKNGIKTRPVEKIFVNEEFFKEIDIEEKAYILGWWYSDGNVTPTGAIRIGIQIDDEEILLWMKNQLKYEGNLHYNKSKNNKKKDIVELCINRQNMAKDLIKLGCPPKKSLILKFPNFLREDLIRHFVRGYFDGDGCVYRSSKNCYSVSITGSYDFIYGLANIIPCNYSCICQRYKNRQPEKSAHQLNITKRTESLKFLHWIYDDCTCKLQRKYDKAKIFLTA